MLKIQPRFFFCYSLWAHGEQHLGPHTDLFFSVALRQKNVSSLDRSWVLHTPAVVLREHPAFENPCEAANGYAICKLKC